MSDSLLPLLRCLENDLKSDASVKDLYPGCATRTAAEISLRRSILKKWESENSEEADQACLQKFHSVNLTCEQWAVPECHHSWQEVAIGELKRSIDSFFHPAGDILVGSYGSILSKGRVGPGASIAARGGSFYAKLFSSKLTTTDRFLYDEYRRYVANFAEWSNAELTRSATFGDADIVRGNVLSFVPKYTHISRSICTEPSLNMFFQLGLGKILEDRLADYFGIDMSVQQFKNRELARRGSLGLGFSTYDLESASDSIGLKMCRWLLPRWFNHYLERLRSPCTLIGSDEHELHMVSTMGNGFTFPLQTIIFSCMVEASYRVCGVPLHKPYGKEMGSFAVFGDDIIVDSRAGRCLEFLLKACGFVVNPSKSFVEGPFRESCGADYYAGVNIRGVYIKRLKCRQDFFAAINQLSLFSTRTGVLLPTLTKWLVKRAGWLPVPRWEDASAGIWVPLAVVSKRLKADRNGSAIYQKFVARSSRIRINECGFIYPSGAKRLIYNPSGLLLAFLQGSVRSSSIAIRSDSVRWVSKRGVAPNWDATPTQHPLSGWFNWERWETASTLNLFM